MKKCPVVDTSWAETETGGFMITPLPGAIELKAGSTPALWRTAWCWWDNEGHPQEGATEGANLVFHRPPRPGQAHPVRRFCERFEQTYFYL